jgi:hypothetical protein
MADWAQWLPGFSDEIRETVYVSQSRDASSNRLF